MSLRELLQAITPGRKDLRNLTRQEAYRAFDAILSRSEPDATVAAFLVALRAKGVTVDELGGFASSARDHATLSCEDMLGLVCVCQPIAGCTESPPLDVAAGLIAAGAGARVLLHSDRNVPPVRGITAASVLDFLGASMTWDPKEAEDWVAKIKGDRREVVGGGGDLGSDSALFVKATISDDLLLASPGQAPMLHPMSVLTQVHH